MACKWNTTTKGSTVVITNNDLTVTGVKPSNPAFGTISHTTGKWYWELHNDNNVGNAPCVGFSDTLSSTQNYTDNNTITWSGFNGVLYPNGGSYGVSPWWNTTGVTVGIAIDIDNRLISYYVDGVAIITDQSIPVITTGMTTPVYPCLTSATSGSSGNVMTANFGATAFSYTPPTGYVAWDCVVVRKRRTIILL